jgi:hypothetical protein
MLSCRSRAHRSEPQHRCHSSLPVEHDLKRLRATSARSLSTLRAARLVHPLDGPRRDDAARSARAEERGAVAIS